MRTPDLLRCIGILIDNAAEAVQKDSGDIDIMITAAKDETVFIISNTAHESPNLSMIWKKATQPKGKTVVSDCTAISRSRTNIKTLPVLLPGGISVFTRNYELEELLMIQILLCDDDHQIRAEIEKQINNQILICQYDMQIAESTASPSVLLNHLKQIKQRQNLYFLDVELKDPEYDGFLLGQEIRLTDPKASSSMLPVSGILLTKPSNTM